MNEDDIYTKLQDLESRLHYLEKLYSPKEQYGYREEL